MGPKDRHARTGRRPDVHRGGLFAGAAGIAIAASGVDPIRSSSDRHIDELISNPHSEVVATESGFVPEQVVTTVDELETILGEQFESQVNKVIDHIDEHCRAWIERSPFVVVTSSSAMGAMDVSPKGDPPGFVRVLDPKTLAVPDRPGNHRGDTFRNVLENPQVGLMFVVPRRREVVRVSGTAIVVKDAPLLASMAVGDKAPSLALVVRVQEAMFHCGKSMIRSHMWEPDLWLQVDGLPTYGRALVDHAALDRPVAEMEHLTDLNEKYRLYDD